MMVRRPVRSLLIGAAVTAVCLAPVIAAAQIIIDFDEPGADSHHTETFEHLGFNDGDLMIVNDHTFSTDDTRFFRYADDANGPPTLSTDEFPFLAVDTMSFGTVTWPEELLPDLAAPGDGIFLPIGDGIMPGREYLLGTVTLNGPLPDSPVGGILSKNLGFALQIDGTMEWDPHASYPFDTWGGTCCQIWAGYYPNPWMGHINTIGEGNAIQDRTDVNGFVMLHGSTAVFAADRMQLIGDAPDGLIRLRFYNHFSDDHHGSIPESLSSIQTIPDIAGSDPFLNPPLYSMTIGDNEFIDPVTGDTLKSQEEFDASQGSGSGSGSDSADDGSVLDETLSDDDPILGDSGQSTDLITEDPFVPGPSSTSNPTWPWIVGTSGVILVAGGEAVRRRGRNQAATNPNEDGFLFEALAKLGGTGATTVSAGDSDHAWTIAIGPELRAQDDIKRIQGAVIANFATWHGHFKTAMVRFAEAYLSAWQGSDALRENQSDWRVAQIGAKAADLAVALIQLVRGAFMLGRGLAGWYRGRQAAALAAKSADEVAALRSVADDALEASPQLKAFADEFMGAGRGGLKTYRDELVDVIMWGQQAGVDVIPIMLKRLDDLEGFHRTRVIGRLVEDTIPHIMRASGLVEAVPAVATAVENTAGVMRVLATEGAQLSDEGAAGIRAFVQMVDDTPGFWDDAGNMFVKLARGTDDMLTGELAPLVSGDRLTSLRLMYVAVKESGGDIPKAAQLFRDAVGPAKATALANGAGATSAIPSALVQDGAITMGHGGAVAGTSGTDAGPVQVGLGSVDSQMHQYGITGDSFGGNMWDLITSPVETTTGIYYSWGALDEINHLFENNATDLSEMSSAWTQLTNSLGGLDTFVRGGASGADPIGELQEAVADLGRARTGLQNVWDHASPEWQQANRTRFNDKMAHIDRKKATIERLITALQRLKVAIGRLKETLEALETTPDGDRRTSLEWIDPALSQALTQVAFQLEAIGHDVLATD